MPRSENVKTPAFFSVGCRVRRGFERFVAMQSKLYGVELPLPAYSPGPKSCQDLKKFCCTLLEDPRSHPWHGATKRLSSDARMSIAMSLFLFRKCIPSPEPDCDEYLDRMSTRRAEPDARFVKYVRKKVRKMFPTGWDCELYPNAALNSVIPVKSCVQRSMAKGGSRLEVLSRSERAHHDYVCKVLSEEHAVTLLPSRVTPVETGGKWRIVSVADVDMNILRPLHTSIYNRISRFPWLLRGEATRGKFKDFTTREGYVFVSGDYESATDNLNLTVQREILTAILEGTTWVPNGVKELALRSQQMTLTSSGGKVVHQESGQLMGNLLSFPLLCLVNYLAFRYYTNDRDIPVRINGDDIVFRCKPEVFRRWEAGVVGSGLVLSKGKTMVHSRYFSLNSRLFKSTSSKPWVVPCVRSTAMGFRKPEDGVASLAGRWRCVLRDLRPGPQRREIVEEEFLRWNVPYIVASRRSLTRGLGMKFSYEALSRVNLWKREAWYLSLEREDPLPPSPAMVDQLRIPDGWQLRQVEKITKEMKQVMNSIGPEFVACSWAPAQLTCAEAFERYRETVNRAPYYEPVSTGTTKRRARLLGLSPANAKRYLKPAILSQGRLVRGRDILQCFPQRGKRIWLPAGMFRPTSLMDFVRQ
nr:MAG: putative RNA-dependent RNA polymerase [Botourmiaviridae sp.]